MRLNRKHLFWFKSAFHILAILPLVYLAYRVFTDEAGGDPVQYIIQFTGIGALNILVILLCMSPIARKFKLGGIIQMRRMVGLYVFFYATLHVFAFISLDLLFEWSLLMQEILKRPYILVGASGYVILLALAVTSFTLLRRKMGKRWQQLHNLVYLLAILIPIHFYWSVKSEVIEPSIYIIITWVLLIWRTPCLARLSRVFVRLKIKFRLS